MTIVLHSNAQQRRVVFHRPAWSSWTLPIPQARKICVPHILTREISPSKETSSAVQPNLGASEGADRGPPWKVARTPEECGASCMGCATARRRPHLRPRRHGVPEFARPPPLSCTRVPSIINVAVKPRNKWTTSMPLCWLYSIRLCFGLPLGDGRIWRVSLHRICFVSTLATFLFFVLLLLRMALSV